MQNIQTSDHEYTVGAARHVGFVAHDAAIQGPRPGVILIHEWWGVDDEIRERARQIAALGYVAFVIDMFGDGRTAADVAGAAGLMQGVLDDMETGTRRLRAGFETLRAMPLVDADRTAAMGYCFGGAMALHMARIGLPLKAVASFHGALGSFHRPAPGSVKARILVCHGAADAMVSAGDVEAFRAEMDAAGADYEVIVYPDAMHGFAVPAATERGKRFGIPVGHNEAADKASWDAMRKLYAEVL
ncbi:MAG: dienelactone hydrolase family protein [Chromatiales bacterium]|nr:dienelactone hydrolase family protein [Chromatiales bacterium]